MITDTRPPGTGVMAAVRDGSMRTEHGEGHGVENGFFRLKGAHGAISLAVDPHGRGACPRPFVLRGHLGDEDIAGPARSAWPEMESWSSGPTARGRPCGCCRCERAPGGCGQRARGARCAGAAAPRARLISGGGVRVDLGSLTQFFREEPDVRLAYLFGSQARGEAGPLSDVDLAVVLSGDPAGQGARRDVLNGSLTHLLGRNDVDLVLADRAPPLLRHRIARGICIFARNPVEATRFAATALRDVEDTRPLRDAAYAAQKRRLALGQVGLAPQYRRVGQRAEN